MNTNERRAELLARYERVTELPMLALAALVVPIIIVPWVWELNQTLDIALEGAFWIIWGIFAADLGFRTYLAERKASYLTTHWYDVLVVAAPAFELIASSFDFLRASRLVRLVRLFRAFPFLARAFTTARRMAERRGLQYFALAGLATMLATAVGVYFIEHDREGATITSLEDALWWAIATMTTIGYGDTTPQSAAGRGLAVFLMVVGISFFSWATANIAAFLVETGDEEGQSPVTTNDIMDKLEKLEQEIRQLRGAGAPSQDARDGE